MKKKLLATIGVAAIGAALAVPALGAGASVRVDDDFFRAKTVRITQGSTVTWRWVGDRPHNVKFRSFRSTIKKTGSYRHKFTRRGTYRYICTLHDDAGMKGTVIVQ